MDKLSKIIVELIELGENELELALWQKFYPNLEKAEQEKLLKNLEEELKMLKK